MNNLKTKELIELLAQIEKELVTRNNNGVLDIKLYKLRKELDTLRRDLRKE